MAFSSAARSLRARLHLGRVPPALYIGIVIIVIVVAIGAINTVVSNLSAQTFEVTTDDTAESTRTIDETDETSTPAEPATIFVHVVGAVNAPGLYELNDGARVSEAITAAGGFTETAATESVNLARTLNDGEQILVADVSTQQSATVAPPSPSAQSPATAAGGAGGLININTATAEELETLDGVGPATAEKILKDRDANGPFKSVDDLTRVSGIGDKKLDAIRDSICV